MQAGDRFAFTAMKGKPLIRLYTHQGAREVDGVIDELRARGAEIDRRNFCGFPERSAFTIQAGLSHGDIAHAVWAHDLHTFSVERSLIGVAREIALRECNAFLNGLMLREQGRWLNSPEAIWRAGNKPFQLSVAEKLGLPVPPYIVSNDVSSVRAFLRQNRRIVVKALDAAFIIYGRQKPLKVFTRKVVEIDDVMTDALCLGPAIFQKEIDRHHEIRVTVVDGKAFSVAVNVCGLPVNVTDVRQLDYEAERPRFFRLKNIENIERHSVEFCRALGLRYAGLDWAVEPSGKHWLFEANPCGSFRWFEEVGAGPITAAIATALLKQAKAR